MFEFFLWCAALGREFLRIIVTQLVQREATARGDLQRVDKRFRPGAEEVRHLRRALQGALGIGLEAVAGRIDGAVLADASDGVERSEEHTSELQSLMRISYAVSCLQKKKKIT